MTPTVADSPLAVASPLAKLVIALVWLLALATSVDARPPLVLVGVALVAGLALGHVSPGRLARGVAPVWTAALGIAVFNGLFAAVNNDPAAAEVARLGPFRLTEPGLLAGIALGSRVLAIATVGAVFALTTEPTRLVDALVQQGRLPDRFAYGALAAYQAIPRFAADLVAIRQARRIRGLRGGWHPRLLVGLLVLAIRHGDRLALAMDARGFGLGERSRFRVVRWRRQDTVLLVGGVVVALVAASIPLW